MSNITRRRFLEDSILATAAAAVPISAIAADDKKPIAPNDKITVAIIGCGIRGKQHAAELTKMGDCDIAYVCDPDTDRMAEVSKIIVDKKRPAPKAEKDMRKVFDDKTVDAVVICNCNHWHALSAIWAMQSMKDVYVEKPVSHNVSEGRRIVQVARKYKRICQGGTQNRSNAALAAAVDYMRSGKLGEVKLARSIVYGRRGSIGGPGKCEIPATVDYDLWAGPAPKAPITRGKFHYDWHWVWDTGNGELGNNNIHSLDICRWGLGVTGLGQSVVSFGGRFGYTDAGETPNTQVCVFDFDKQTIVSETRGLKTEPFHADLKGSWIFYGTEGIIAGTSLFDPKGKLIRTFEGKTESHIANFFKAMRTRRNEDLTADILEGHQSTALCHIGNISWRLGRTFSGTETREHLKEIKPHDAALETFDRTAQHLKDNEVDLNKTKLTLGPLLVLDGDKEAFAKNGKADALLTREYRKPFIVPADNAI
jgi:predicted dehydrogenase